MKADAGAQKWLLALQDVDTSIKQAQHKLSTLPELAELVGVQSKGKHLSQELVACDTAVSDAELAVRRAEADLVPVRERLVKNQERVDAGQGDPKSLTAMIEEIGHLKKRISDLEDSELECMETLEQAIKQRDAVRTELTSLKAKFGELMSSRDAKAVEINASLSALQKRRGEIVPVIPAPLLANYEKITARLGSGAAQLVGGRCTGCGIQANSADLIRYETAAVDDVIYCEECSRILVRAS